MNQETLDNQELALLAAEAGAGDIAGCLDNRDFEGRRPGQNFSSPSTPGQKLVGVTKCCPR